MKRTVRCIKSFNNVSYGKLTKFVKGKSYQLRYVDNYGFVVVVPVVRKYIRRVNDEYKNVTKPMNTHIHVEYKNSKFFHDSDIFVVRLLGSGWEHED